MLRIFHRKDTYEVKCPDGTTRNVYRKIDDAFPLFIPGIEVAGGAKAKATDEVDGSIDVKYKSKIQGILVEFEEGRRSIVLDFRAAYVAFQADPCGNSDFLTRSVTRIHERRDYLQKLKLQLDALIEIVKTRSHHSVAIEQKLSEIIGGIAPEKDIETTISKLEQAEKLAEKMIEADKS